MKIRARQELTIVDCRFTIKDVQDNIDFLDGVDDMGGFDSKFQVEEALRNRTVRVYVRQEV